LQLIGTTVGGFASVFAFWLYTSAYPCILDMEAEDCAFATSAARAWKACMPRDVMVTAFCGSLIGAT
jgi:hypothetical protein